jgi:predicted transcriptional regulator with HTH domain
MYESIKKTAMADGLSAREANVLVEIYKAKTTASEISKNIGLRTATVANCLKGLRAKYKARTTTNLITICAPYIKGELINKKEGISGNSGN